MPLSTYLVGKLLTHALKGTAFVQPTNLNLALSKADPTPDASGLSEVSGGAYARQTVNAWTQSGRGSSNTSTINFSQATAPWGTVTHWALFDDAGSPNLFAYGALVSGCVVFAADAATNKITAPGHSFSNGDQVRVCSVALPSGLSAATTYFVIGVSGDTFQLSLSSGGSAVDITGDGLGEIGKDLTQTVQIGNTVSIAGGQLAIAMP